MEISTTDVVGHLLAMEQYQPQSDNPEPGRPFLAMVRVAAEGFLQGAPHGTHGTPIFVPDRGSLLSLLLMRGYQGAARQLLKHKAIDSPEDNLEQWLSPDNVVRDGRSKVLEILLQDGLSANMVIRGCGLLLHAAAYGQI